MGRSQPRKIPRPAGYMSILGKRDLLIFCFSERHQNWANGTTPKTSTVSNNPVADSTDSHVGGSSAPATPTTSSAPTLITSEVSQQRIKIPQAKIFKMYTLLERYWIREERGNP